MILALKKTKEGSTKSLTVPCNDVMTTNFSSEVSSSSHASPDRMIIANNSSAKDTKNHAKIEELPTNKINYQQKESLESKRERKAAKTLAIITGEFVMILCAKD